MAWKYVLPSYAGGGSFAVPEEYPIADGDVLTLTVVHATDEQSLDYIVGESFEVSLPDTIVLGADIAIEVGDRVILINVGGPTDAESVPDAPTPDVGCGDVGFDTSGLWSVLPNTETVTLYGYEGGDEFADGFDVGKVERRPLAVDIQTALGIGLDSEAATFHFWKAWLGGRIPKTSDEFVDCSGSRWVIRKPLGLELAGQRWRLACVRVS